MTAVDDDRYADDDAPTAARAPRIRYNPPDTRGEDAYRRATRHSALVRRLRIILPVLAIIAVAAFWATMRVVPGDMSSLVSVAGIDTKANSVTMDKPHISGFEGTRRAYEVRAENAVQNLDDPKVVTFNQIVGKFGLEDAGVATVNAAVGVYDGNHNTLVIKDGATVETTTGYSGRLSAAAIDLAKGTFASDAPLEFKMKEGSVRANAMRATDNGKHIFFTGGVSVTYLPPGELAAAPGATSGVTQP